MCVCEWVQKSFSQIEGKKFPRMRTRKRRFEVIYSNDVFFPIRFRQGGGGGRFQNCILSIVLQAVLWIDSQSVDK